MHIGIVTFEFPGLTKNGGIGTAYGRLAELLLRHGHKVSVLFVNVISEIGSLNKTRALCNKSSIKKLLSK